MYLHECQRKGVRESEERPKEGGNSDDGSKRSPKKKKTQNTTEEPSLVWARTKRNKRTPQSDIHPNEEHTRR